MPEAALLLPPDTDLGFHVGRLGPTREAEFEGWQQDPENPFELIEGWVVPMSPGTFAAGRAVLRLATVLERVADARSWSLAFDARHRLPRPPHSVVFPDLALHCTEDVTTVAGTETVARVPDLVIEILGVETEERDRGPLGAKYRAYEASGVKEYYCAWPDGREASAFHLVDGRFVAVDPDERRAFASRILGGRLRLVPAGFIAG